MKTPAQIALACTAALVAAGCTTAPTAPGTTMERIRSELRVLVGE